MAAAAAAAPGNDHPARPPVAPEYNNLNGDHPWGRHALPMFLPVIALIFFLAALLSFYLFRHLASAWLRRRRGAAAAAPPRFEDTEVGLDADVIASFPTLRYSALKGAAKEGRCPRECAVCLSEFGGKDRVRLLTVCRHAFHPGCIDPWLAGRTTCPICRSDLRKSGALAALMATEVEGEADGGDADSYAVRFDDGGRVVLAELLEDWEASAADRGGGGGDGHVGRVDGT